MNKKKKRTDQDEWKVCQGVIITIISIISRDNKKKQWGFDPFLPSLPLPFLYKKKIYKLIRKIC
jgi:hypothetical protein